ncbi:helix-turn-helix domain-containing protein [Cryobacterium breve]|uniref:helix-turn-helix domain-containing protein n=1 Tax=Cryobacterium breve TaxID=1259258 RepID=UPI0032B159C3
MPLADSALDSHSLRIVQALAEHGSITAAARALGYSQPAVSQQAQTPRACGWDSPWWSGSAGVCASPRPAGCSPGTPAP